MKIQKTKHVKILTSQSETVKKNFLRLFLRVFLQEKIYKYGKFEGYKKTKMQNNNRMMINNKKWKR